MAEEMKTAPGPWIICLFWVLMIGWSGIFDHAVAQETGDPIQAGEAAEGKPSSFWQDHVTLGGFVRGEVHVPACYGDESERYFGTTDTYFVVTNELKAEAFFSDALSGLLNLRYRFEDIGRDVDEASLIGNHADAEFDAREAYLQFRGDWLDVTVGQQILAWGVADGINPTNRMSPNDMTLISSDSDDRRLGVPVVKADAYLGKFTLTGVWQPFFVDSKFRLSRIPEEAEITIEDPQLPARRLNNATVAFKCAATLGSTDASISYAYGWDPFPDIILGEAVMTDDVTRVSVIPVFNRVENFGADVSTVLGPVILRAEGAYTRVKERGSRSPGRQKSTIQWIAGPEMELFEDFTMNVQYGVTHVLDWEPIEADDSVIENDPQAGVDAFNARLHRQLEEKNPMMTLRLDYQLLQDTLFLQFRGLYYFNDHELRLRPQIGYDVTDRFNVTLAADLAFGDLDSRFDRSGKNYNEVFTELKYSF
ncbi:MAG: hypothetical protein PVG49_03000 [Desulfobacteraceae bacterium]|jgi:hypothetical protein